MSVTTFNPAALSHHREGTEMHENEIGTAIVDCAVPLHQALGPGLLESAYEVTGAKQMEKRGLSVRRQVPVPIEFEGQQFEEGFRADLPTRLSSRTTAIPEV